MSECEINIRQKVDLHYGRKNFSDNKNYVEFSFHACFYEIFNIENSYWETDLSGREIFEIFERLNIKVDKAFITQKYQDNHNHDVEVFHSESDEQVFTYLDLQKDPTDQNDMCYIGISCSIADERIIHEMLLNIYRKLKTSSSFVFDIWNKGLYYKVFQSYFYFYGNHYDENKRKIQHHIP